MKIIYTVSRSKSNDRFNFDGMIREPLVKHIVKDYLDKEESIRFYYQEEPKSQQIAEVTEKAEAHNNEPVKPVTLFPEITNCWFNPEKGTTVVKWSTGDKTMVRTQQGEKFDAEKGMALCYMKKALGNKSSFNEMLKKYCKSIEKGERE